MSAVEEIQAAIDKLTEMRGDSAEWWVFEPDPNAIYQTTEDGREDHVLDTVEESDRDLIVTLHRTIDAQLAILADTLNAFSNPIPAFIGYEEQIYHAQLMLARAINGDTQ
jgi:hypothetical protein